MFHPFELSAADHRKASLYIEIRDAYHELYRTEAEAHRANPALREMLNRLYDGFTESFGKLNDHKNRELVRMDAGGMEILSLEREQGGQLVKADIFERPVAFNPNEITRADSIRDALAASLNRYATVNLSYIQEITGKPAEEITEELKGVVYYNPLMNAYDGSHQTFPGLDLKALGIPGLYDSQKDAVWMDIHNGGAIIDHEVGGGKTLIMCVSAYEKKRLGLVNKPLSMALKANVHEIAKTFCTAYPMARVLYPGKEDFTPQKRKRIFNEIKNNDWDAVILTHEQFGMIPQSPEVKQDILRPNSIRWRKIWTFCAMPARRFPARWKKDSSSVNRTSKQNSKTSPTK